MNYSSSRRVFGFLFILLLLSVPFAGQAKTAAKTAKPAEPAVVVPTGPLVLTDEHIENFDSKIVVHPDSSVDVTETVLYDFGGQQKHGIYRDIPMVKAPGAIASAALSGVTVTDQLGRPYTINSIDYTGGMMSVKIGDADRTITGLHTYIVSYHVRRAIGYFGDYDEIYWNATGNEWTVPIREVTATVSIPGVFTVDQLHLSSYCGAYGENGTCGKVDVKNDGTATLATFSSDVFTEGSFFQISQGMTVGVGFPKGVVAVGTLAWYEKDSTYYAFAFVIFGLFLVSFVYWLVSYYLPEHRKRKQPIIAEYEPPKGITPSVAGYIYSKTGLTSSKMATSDILYLASEGFITIESVEDGEKAKSSSSDMNMKIALFVLLVLAIGFVFSWWILLLGLVVGLLHYKETVSSIKAFLHPVDFKLTRTSKACTGPSHLEKIYSLVTGPGVTVDLAELKKESHYNAFDNYASEVKDAAASAEAEGVDAPAKLSKNGMVNRAVFSCVLIMLVIFMGVHLGAFIAAFQNAAIPDTVAIDFLVLVVSATIFWFIRSGLRSSLDHMTPTWYAVAGLREYIRVAEKDRINFESNPADSARIFSKLLPYATAFGLEDKWAGVFAGIVTTPPEWYHSTSGRAFNAAIFATSMHSFGSTLATASNSGRPAPSSGSGSFGGGGFSGGGGGGGGGGSW